MPTRFAHPEYLESVSALSKLFKNELSDDLGGPVDHLKPWTRADLVGHLGTVYSTASGAVADPDTERPELGNESQPPPGAGIVDWFARRRETLLAAFDAASPNAAAWSFAGTTDTTWWARRMAHETAVHLWDLRASTRSPSTATPIDSGLAIDGIDEYVDVGLQHSIRRPHRVYPAATLHLHCTDGDGEWMFARGDGEREVSVTHEHGKGDAAVRGTASSLLLWIWGRPASGLEIFGDPSTAQEWQALAP